MHYMSAVSMPTSEVPPARRTAELTQHSSCDGVSAHYWPIRCRVRLICHEPDSRIDVGETTTAEVTNQSMRVFFSLVGVIVILGLLAFGQRKQNRQLAQVLAAFALLFAVLLAAAFVGLY